MIASVLCVGLIVGVASQGAFLGPAKRNLTKIAGDINDPHLGSPPMGPVGGPGFHCATICVDTFTQVCMDAETKCDKESKTFGNDTASRGPTNLFKRQQKLVCLLDEFNRSQVALDDCAKCKECAKDRSGTIGWREEHGVATCTYEYLKECDGLNMTARCFPADASCTGVPEDEKPGCLKGFLGNEKSFHLCESCSLCQSLLEDNWNEVSGSLQTDIPVAGDNTSIAGNISDATLAGVPGFHCATTCNDAFTQVCMDAEMKCDRKSEMSHNDTASRGPTDLFKRQEKLVCLLDEVNRSQVALDDCAKCKECAKDGSGSIGWREHGVATCTYEVLTDCDGLNRDRCSEADDHCKGVPEYEKPSCLKEILGNEKSFHLCENCALCQSQFEGKWSSFV